ncbi:tripartite tricarboxylate transporter TctB family protein [uncultured Vibrio sp.]|uniref:tripartite tricarboxylate transporter TctB family protein n=1 Tax=uncultured Vibrio sp. TaxID=114054 RepID=UPI00262A3BD3|nr:tripartite tricarboxylate transporter TctB family protein [uncultured Vibrio sp.]
MRFWFSLSTFLFSLAFLIYGLQTLDIYDFNGRPGPGYFPLIIGVGLLISTGINVYKDLKERRGQTLEIVEPADPELVYAKDAIATAACIGLLIFSLNFLGAIVAMIAFCLAFLSYFNRGKHLQNAGYSIAFPMSVFLLFDVWLQAGLPDGLLRLFY